MPAHPWHEGLKEPTAVGHAAWVIPGKVGSAPGSPASTWAAIVVVTSHANVSATGGHGMRWRDRRHLRRSQAARRAWAGSRPVSSSPSEPPAYETKKRSKPSLSQWQKKFLFRKRFQFAFRQRTIGISRITIRVRQWAFSSGAEHLWNRDVAYLDCLVLVARLDRATIAARTVG